MASEPTLKDVLKILAEMRADAAAHRAETAALTEKVDRGFARVDAKLTDIEDELEVHTKAHEEIDKQLAALKRAPRPTARAPRARRTR